jgi:hypothetical protein
VEILLKGDYIDDEIIIKALITHDKKDVYTEKEFHILGIYESFNKKNKHKMVPIPIFDLKENEII